VAVHQRLPRRRPVSQYLIRNVIYDGDQDRDEVVFRVLLFKWFSRISAWELLQDRLGPLRVGSFDPAAADRQAFAPRRHPRPLGSTRRVLGNVDPVDGRTQPVADAGPFELAGGVNAGRTSKRVRRGL
jgi:hypothetical protein